MQAFKGKSAMKWAAVTALALGMVAPGAHGQDWPQRSIRLVIPGPPGGSSDVPARMMAQTMGEFLKQTVVVENRPGAGGMIAAREAANAAPDGYTILLSVGSAITISTGTMPEMAATVKKLQPLGMLAYTPLAVAVTEASPIRSFEQLIQAARDKPDTLVLANPGVNTLAHLTTELLIDRGKAPLRAIAFNSFAAELVAVKSGDAAAMIDGIGPILAQAGTNGLRILALSSPDHPPGLEQYPLIRQTVPDTSSTGWFGLFTPAGVPEPVLQRLSAALDNARQDEKLAAALKKLGMYVRHDTPREFADYVREETALWHGELARLGMGITQTASQSAGSAPKAK